MLLDSSLNIFQTAACGKCTDCLDSMLSLYCPHCQAADDEFLSSKTFSWIALPSCLLVLPLPVCLRGNPFFVSQGSSANWENLKLSTKPKQLEHIWSWRVADKCISQHSGLVITSALETTRCKGSTVKQFPELSITRAWAVAQHRDIVSSGDCSLSA